MTLSIRRTIQALGAALACAVALTACPPTSSAPDASSGPPCFPSRRCGEECCTRDQICHEGSCCAPLDCSERECGDDGCGTSCGTCTGEKTCNAATGRCEAGCVSETAQQFCQRLAAAGKVCGTVVDEDNCTGEERSEECGGCGAGSTCQADNTCSGSAPDACVPETTIEFCHRMEASGKECGTIQALGLCRESREEDCGDCGVGQTCTADHRCVLTCAPETAQELCARLGKDCGTVSGIDNCGTSRQVDCGGCASGSCVDNLCQTCMGEDQAAFCDRMAGQGRECGVVSGQDLCGTPRQEDCGTSRCGGGTVCNHDTNACWTCTQETGFEFCARATGPGEECGFVTDADNCTRLPRTVDCGDGACVNGKTCQGSTCVGPAATCTGPAVLQADASDPDHFVALGDTSKGSASLDGSCSTGSGAEVVFELTVSGSVPRSLLATASAAFGSSLSPALYLRPSCPSQTDEVCHAAAGSAMVWVASLAPGTYVVVVDSASAASEGAFVLDVVLGPTDVAPANDTCAEAVVLEFIPRPEETGTIATAMGTTRGATNDSEGACAAAGAAHVGGDVVYALDVPAGPDQAVTVSVFPDATSAGYSPAVYVRRVCDDAAPANEVGCANSGQLVIPSLAPGTYYLVVDGLSGTVGSFDLAVRQD